MAEKEYIEREAAYKACEAYFSGVCVYDVSESEVINDFEKVIDAVPTADVAPVKHGHFRRLTFSGDTIICSECKMAYNIFETNGAENFNFCPHCGAKIMDGGEENDG